MGEQEHMLRATGRPRPVWGLGLFSLISQCLFLSNDVRIHLRLQLTFLPYPLVFCLVKNCSQGQVKGCGPVVSVTLTSSHSKLLCTLEIPADSQIMSMGQLQVSYSPSDALVQILQSLCTRSILSGFSWL